MSRIPFVTEGTLDVASDINDSIKVIDGLVAGRVKGFATAPPAAPEDGDRWAIEVGATGEWEGLDAHVAFYVAEGDFWNILDSVLVVHETILYVSDGVKWEAVADTEDRWIKEGDPRLSDDREWSAPTATLLEVQAGLSEERKAFTPKLLQEGARSFLENNEEEIKLLLVGDIQGILDEILEGSV